MLMQSMSACWLALIRCPEHYVRVVIIVIRWASMITIITGGCHLLRRSSASPSIGASRRLLTVFRWILSWLGWAIGCLNVVGALSTARYLPKTGPLVNKFVNY
jgi:hypothetical protein